MTGKREMIRDVEKALAHSSARTKAGRFAVYVPKQVVIGTYDREDEARAVAEQWATQGVDTVVVDREAGGRRPLGAMAIMDGTGGDPARRHGRGGPALRPRRGPG